MANLIMPLQIERQYSASLDANYEFGTLDELKDYATASALSYPGQILYCKADDALYKVNATKTDVDPVGEGGGGAKTYTTLAQLGLTADATLNDAIAAMSFGSSALLGVTEFTDYQTIFPYTEGNDQFGRVFIEKGNDAGRIYVKWFRKDGKKEALAVMNINNNQVEGWNLNSFTNTYTALAELGLTADATVDDVLGKLQPGEIFTSGVTQFTDYQTLFPYDTSDDQYSRVFIQQGNSLATAYVKWFRKDGSREALAKMDSHNKVVGWNEHTMNEIIHTSLTESLAGITTTLDLINALITEYRAKNKPVKFVSGSLTQTQLTDLPLTYGLLTIVVAGYDVVEVTFAQSNFGFKQMYYGYLNRASSETLFSSLSWVEVNTSTTTLVTNTSTLKLDITKKNSSWYGAIKLTYLYATSPVEVEIDFRSSTDTLTWNVANGQKYVKAITYTQDTANTAHYTIGIEFSGTTYGCYQADVIGGFAVINSLTKDAFTGDTTAIYGNVWGKNNGVSLVSAPEDLGLTSPCTTVELAQAMRNTFNKTITSGAIGIFNNGGSTITDAPSDYGLLHIEVFGHDRMMIRYDGISGSTYAGSWIGQIKGNNGTFSGITWEKPVINPYDSNIYKTYCGTGELNSAKGTSITLETNVDNTQKIIDALGAREEFVDWFGNSNNRFGLAPATYGDKINYLRIVKTSNANAVILAATSSGIVASRIYDSGTLGDWKAKTDFVTLSGSQALTNKTYNGYSLGAACAKGVATTVASGNTNLVTSGAVYSAMPKYSLSGTTLTITTT